MKKYSFLTIFVIFLFNCSQNKQKTNGKSISLIKSDVNLLLNNWHKAAADADFNGYFEKMDSISVYIGTDATENWTKKQFQNFSKPYFEKGKAWSFKTLKRNIYVSKLQEVVWFDELLDTWMGTCRGSGVLEKNKDTWKIKHYVLSVPIPNDDINDVIAVKKKNDSILLNTLMK
ncbi:nuclear transport factor 2 family protein [Polaribacter sp. MSW13]|uniref:Nuclear transport factor 2 family protein n=1 Tax=Polaribacter marinus TaxID=2916838 RepID=A0A9X1VNF1_9FLAO|nr:nuclear transport factor 2 family protein [Polaribacter marinus]MCI2229265.1 nuclear transport factor 2 family protein [Polaribacter marinus]